MQEEKLKELLDSLTLKEKIGQLIQLSGDFYSEDEALKVGPAGKLGISPEMVDLSGSVLNVIGAEKTKQIQESYLKKSRHKIPLLFMADIIYGYKTVYPIPLGMGAAWDPGLVKESYEAISDEAKASGLHVTFSPMVDLVRDARWGRCLESPGEDPVLNSRYAKAMVEGFQKNLSENEGIASCVKHFAAYGAAEAGREYNTVDMSERRLREEYLPSYKAAVDAGCEMVMTSFNTVDGIPATANQWLMDDVLRKEWGFDGVIITDYAAIAELIAHGVAADEKEASLLAMNAGVDIDMKTACYSEQLQPLVEEGKISEKKIDEAVWRILKLKNKLGLFENPFRGASPQKEAEEFSNPTHHALARKLTEESMVLLKNEDKILPLVPNDKKVALIGPYADSKSLIGLWAVHADESNNKTIQEVMAETLDKEHFRCAKGCDILEDLSPLGDFGFLFAGAPESDEEKRARLAAEHQEAMETADWADVIVLALGEHVLQSGEAGSRTNLRLPEHQQKLLEEMKSLGKPIVLLLVNGRPLVLSETEPFADAIVEMWFPGSEGAAAVCNILFGKANPSGRLTMGFPETEGQLPLYYRALNTGRPLATSTHSSRFMSRYTDCSNDPKYPFGYGLSYHTSVLSNLKLSTDRMKKDSCITVTVTIENTGDVSGCDVVQLYTRDFVGSVARPILELKDFCRVVTEPGEKKQISFVITEEMLRFYTKNMTFASEPGRFGVYVGLNSVDVLKAEFELI